MLNEKAEKYQSFAIVPQHVAIIMDGNSRWSNAQGLPQIKGYQAGIERLTDLLDVCLHYNIRSLTLFTLSRENCARPSLEVGGLLTLFRKKLKQELHNLIANGIRLQVIGERNRLPKDILELITVAEQKTAVDYKYHLNVALAYSGQWDITQAMRRLAQKVEQGELSAENIDIELINRHVYLSKQPPVDLCIRTGGESRLSNFLLWQLAYSELYFSSLYWPDFTAESFVDALADFSTRQRRFGLRENISV